MTLDLAGMGDHADAEGPFTLDRYADEVGKVADLLAGPVVIVGHSVGAPITELVAAKRPDTVALVLIVSVPLAGTHFPAEALAPFSQAAGKRRGHACLYLGRFRRGPVLLLPGATDTVASPDSVKNQVAPGFAEARILWSRMRATGPTSSSTR